MPRSRCIQQPWTWRTASQKPDGYSQACYATTGNHERAVLKQLLGELDLGGVLIQADTLHTQKPFFTTQLFLTSLRTTPEALLQLVRDR